MTAIVHPNLPSQIEPIFNDGSSLFTVLSLAIVLALYLRTIHSWAGESLESIVSEDEHLGWPVTSKFTYDLEEHLIAVQNEVATISPKLIYFILFLTFRALFLVGHINFPWLLPNWFGNILDFLIVMGLFIGIWQMRKVHNRLNDVEKPIRRTMLKHHRDRREALRVPSPEAATGAGT